MLVKTAAVAGDSYISILRRLFEAAAGNPAAGVSTWGVLGCAAPVSTTTTLTVDWHDRVLKWTGGSTLKLEEVSGGQVTGYSYTYSQTIAVGDVWWLVINAGAMAVVRASTTQTDDFWLVLDTPDSPVTRDAAVSRFVIYTKTSVSSFDSAGSDYTKYYGVNNQTVPVVETGVSSIVATSVSNSQHYDPGVGSLVTPSRSVVATSKQGMAWVVPGMASFPVGSARPSAGSLYGENGLTWVCTSNGIMWGGE